MDTSENQEPTQFASFHKWNELDDDNKRRVIQQLDIQTMINLRNTSHTERAIVDKTKKNVKSRAIVFSGFTSGKSYYLDCFGGGGSTVPCNNFRLFEFALKHKIYGELQVDTKRKMIADKMNVPNGTVQVEHLDLKFNVTEDFQFWMKAVNDKVKKITVRVHREMEDPEKMLENAKFLHVPHLALHTLRAPSTVPKIAQIWMEGGFPIGQVFEILLHQGGGFNEFKKKFKSKIVSKTEKYCRISTNDESKHILLLNSQPGNGNGEHDEDDEFLKLTIISAYLDNKMLDLSNDWTIAIAKDYDYPDYDSDQESEDDDLVEILDRRVFGGYHEFPDKVKVEKAKKLDFKTLFNLYNTSKSERSLVDSCEKLKVYNGEFIFSELENTTIIKLSESSEEQLEYSSNWKQNPKLHGFILKRCEFEELVVHGEKDNTFYENYDNSEAKYIAKRLKLNYHSKQQLKFWLDRMDGEKLEGIELCSSEQTKDIFDMEKMINVPSLQIRSFQNPIDACVKIVKLWINMDLDFDKDIELTGRHCDKESIPLLLKTFKNNIISHSPNKIKIRSNVAGRLIVLHISNIIEWRKFDRRMVCDYEEIEESYSIRIVVIPIATGRD